MVRIIIRHPDVAWVFVLLQSCFHVHYIIHCDIQWHERIINTILWVGKIRAHKYERTDSSSKL